MVGRRGVDSNGSVAEGITAGSDGIGNRLDLGSRLGLSASGANVGDVGCGRVYTCCVSPGSISLSA